MTDSTYFNQVKRIINLFSGLEKRARNILFPTERTGIFTRPDLKPWNKLQKFLYRLSHPYSTEKGPGLIDVIALPAMLMLAFITFAMAFGMIYTVTVSPDNSVKYIGPNDNVLITICGVVGIFLAVISYYWWFEGLATKRYTIGAKLLVVFSFVGFLLLINNAFRQFGVQQLSATTFAVYIVLVIPSLTYFYAISLDAIIEILYATKISIISIRSLHDPLQIENIRGLVNEKIHSGEDESQIWELADLLPGELTTLQNWSQANRDATVHRIVPASVVITILTLIGISDTARSWADNVIQSALAVFIKFLAQPFSDAFWPGIGISLILIPVIWFIKYLARLFGNIAVQNLIIETCIVARHARQVELESQKKQEISITFEGILAWIVNLFKFGN